MSEMGADTQDSTLLKPFLLLMLRLLHELWLCQREYWMSFGALWGVHSDGSPREGTCVCSGVLCAVLGEFPYQAMIPCSFPALEMPKHITDTNKAVMCQPRCSIDVCLMRVGIWSAYPLSLSVEQHLGCKGLFISQP